jgi:ABC-type multidrug transport system ATPase subunit
MQMILGLTASSSGSLEVNGEIGFCPQFDDHLTSTLSLTENLTFYGMLFGLSDPEIDWRIMKLIEDLDISPHRDKLIRELSGGTKRKVAVAIALLSNAPIVVLDEPTSSLDPAARLRVQKLILRERSASRTFLLSTHLLDEAEVLCDQIALMMRGCLFTCGTPRELAAHFGRDWKIDVLVDEENRADEMLRERLPALKLLFVRHTARVYSVPSAEIQLQNVFRILQELKEGDSGIQYFTISALTLENVFLALLKMAEM